MPDLQRLQAGHAAAVLSFELDNRAWFAASVGDRGDDFFDRFAERHAAALADQEAGECAYYVLLDGDGSVLGRFNLYDLADGRANLGYRMAQRACGRGLATAGVRQLCGLAAARHGLRTLRAGASDRNPASARVLTKAGFVAVGAADVGGEPGTWYELDLPAPESPS